MLICLSNWLLACKMIGALANLAKDSQMNGSEGMSSNRNYSIWEKWSSIGDPYDITGAKEVGN